MQQNKKVNYSFLSLSFLSIEYQINFAKFCLKLVFHTYFSNPAKAILSPGTYFAGAFKNINKCLSVQVIPDFFIELLYLNPVVPAALPSKPARIGAEAVFSSPSKA